MELAKLNNQAVDGLRVLVVDDHALFCSGLAMMFRSVPEVAEVAVATTAEQAIQIGNLFQPGVVVMDAALPSYRGFETARLLAESCGRCQIMFLDDAVNHARIRSALGVGALGYWTKHATFDEIASAVLQIASGQPAFCRAAEQYLVRARSGLRFDPGTRAGPVARLTPRELEVLVHLAEGLSVRRCAERLNLSESTVDNHKSHLMRKLGVHSVVELVRLASREGLLPS